MTTTTVTSFSTCPICVQRQPKYSGCAKGTLTSLQQLGHAYFDHLRIHIRNAVHTHYKLPSGVAEAGIESVLNQVRRYPDAADLNEKVIEDGLVITLRHEVLKSNELKHDLARVLGGRRLHEVLSDTDCREIQGHLNGIARIILQKACTMTDCGQHGNRPAASRRPAHFPWGRGPKKKHPRSS